MPTAATNSAVDGGFMFSCSHKTNRDASTFIRTFDNDRQLRFSYHANMARRGVPKRINWYLREWMNTLGVNQAEMIRRTSWSKATASQLYNNVQDYSPKIVNEAAKALSVEPFELLMKPERAMALRRFQDQALQVVEASRASDGPPANVAA